MIPRCVVSDKYKFIYICIAKNATSTLKTEFRRDRYASYQRRYDKIEQEKIEKYFTFTLLRDPVSRLLSAYQELSMRKDGKPLSKDDKSFYAMQDDWSRFQAFLTEVKKGKWDSHVKDQHQYIADKRIDFLGTLEEFDTSLQYVFETLKIPDLPTFPKLRSRQERKIQNNYKKYYIESLDASTESVIREIYKEDVALVRLHRHTALGRSASMNAGQVTQAKTVTLDSLQNSQKHSQDAKAYLLDCYRQKNSQYEKYLVCHMGSLGFYAEITSIARAMIYAHQKKLRFVLHSKNFAYQYKNGWADYFEPIGEEYSPEMEPHVCEHYTFAKKGDPFFSPKTRDTIRAFRVDTITVGDVTIHNMQEILTAFVKMLLRFNKKVKEDISLILNSLQLPEKYVTVHIRRGDKVGDEDIFYPTALYLQHLHTLDADTAVFVMSDDARTVQEVKDCLLYRGLKNAVYSLCEAKHRGFDIWKLRAKAYFFGSAQTTVNNDQEYAQYVYAETLRLLTETLIASHSHQFISTAHSNVAKTVRFLHSNSKACVLLHRGHYKTYANDKGIDVHDMHIATEQNEPYFLFYDIFIHSSRKKITAVAPYYDDDIDFSHYGVDYENVTLSFGSHSVRGTYVPYRLDSWEPSIVLDFEHPALEAYIQEHPCIEVKIQAGDYKRFFTLATKPLPAYETALSVIVRDENRWLPYFLEYYLRCMQVQHIFVYDNLTTEREALLQMLAPYATAGQVSYIPWHYRWRNTKKRKQIGQPPQQVHSLNKYGNCRWIGFFDADEFLRIPGHTIPEFLSQYNANTIGGVSFGLRWFMYKGEASFGQIDNPLFSFFHAKRDALGRKRQKFFVSPHNVRFMRFHWIQEDQTEIQVDDSDIFFHHYYLRQARFEAGKQELDTVYDEYMLRFAEQRALGALGETEPTLAYSQTRELRTAEDWIAHVTAAFQNAEQCQSQLSDDVLSVRGMCGRFTRHFYNNLYHFENCHFLEIGSWAGASICAAMFQNTISAVAIDNWSQFGGP